jgi:hypothetical protein
VIAAPGPVHPWPIGAGPRYHPTAASAAVAAGRPVGRLRCTHGGTTFAVHLELFAKRRVVIVPPRIGAGPGGCAYPLRTDEPTGVVHVRAGARYVLGDLFRVWGRRLGPRGLLSFDGGVTVYVGGRPYGGDPRTVPLRRHAQIVVEVGGHVAPHPTYLFPKGIG